MEKKSNGLRGGAERGRGGTGDWERIGSMFVRTPEFWGAVGKDSFIRPIILLGLTSLFDLSPYRTATSATKLRCKCL